MNTFRPSRSDGRSDRQVVYELVGDAEPDSMFPFDDIQAALSEGLDSPASKSRAYKAVKAANNLLLREKRRYLVSVPGVGYRMIHASEHLPVALGKKTRAETQIKTGIKILREVRMAELAEPERNLIVGQLMIMDGMYQMARASERRHAKQEQVIDEIRRQQEDVNQRLARLETVAS